jgi:hypothetical protein
MPINTTSAPPYTLTVTESAGLADPKGNTSTKSATNSPTDAIDCSDASSKGCSFSRTFSVLDPEYWDVAVGIVVPGTTEAVYTAGTGGAAPKLTLKHHTDAYAFVDLYPFASVAPKESYWPHFNVGVPLTSQSLHRPYVGAAENVSLWGQRKGFPLSIRVFGGIVDMKQQIFSASSPSDLKWVEPGHGYETTMPLGMPPIELRHQRNEGLR